MYKLDLDNLLKGLQDFVNRKVTLEEIHLATGIHKNTLVYFRKGKLNCRKEAVEDIFNYAVNLLEKESTLENKATIPEIVSMLFFVKVLTGSDDSIK